VRIAVESRAPRDAAQVKKLTEAFRLQLARKHRAEARDARARYGEILDVPGIIREAPDAMGASVLPPKILKELRECVTRSKWHDGRANGQTKRFETLATCGARKIIPTCKTCLHDRKAMPESCGVHRLCARCSLRHAKRRRARFGRAKANAMLEARREGRLQRFRKGGRYGEKMLTLTVPHFLRDHAREDLREATRDTIDARIEALHAAWRVFAVQWRRHWKQAHEHRYVRVKDKGIVSRCGPLLHRAFEWTPGTDGTGHPHFHVWIFSPWLPADLVSAWWTSALRAVGVPIAKGERARCKLQSFEDWSPAALVELIKGGNRDALTLSRCLKRGPVDAFVYAEGWSIADVEEFCSPEVRASLYMALEGRRLSQASSHFFLEDEPTLCECCGASEWRVRFEVVIETDVTEGARGPPI
jgi:hypothetical protein